MGGSWALVTSAKNFGVCHAHGLWGDVEPRRIRQLSDGDLVALYIRRNQGEEKYSLPGGGIPTGCQIGAVARVVGAVRETNQQIWPDRMYPYIIDLEWLSPYPPAAYIDTHADRSPVIAGQGDFMIAVSEEQVRSWLHRLRKDSKRW